MNKDTKQLLARLRDQGFTIRRGDSGHYRITNAAGEAVTVPCTPSRGNRSHANSRAALKRIGARL